MDCGKTRIDTKTKVKLWEKHQEKKRQQNGHKNKVKLQFTDNNKDYIC